MAFFNRGSEYDLNRKLLIQKSILLVHGSQSGGRGGYNPVVRTGYMADRLNRRHM